MKVEGICLGPLKCCYDYLGWYRMLWLLHSSGEDNHKTVIALHVFAEDHKGGFDANISCLGTSILL